MKIVDFDSRFVDIFPNVDSTQFFVDRRHLFVDFSTKIVDIDSKVVDIVPSVDSNFMFVDTSLRIFITTIIERFII